MNNDLTTDLGFSEPKTETNSMASIASEYSLYDFCEGYCKGAVAVCKSIKYLIEEDKVEPKIVLRVIDEHIKNFTRELKTMEKEND